MLVTVCTQVYNTKPFLAKCIESVQKQTITDLEYIIIDNGSTDGCKEMLEQYAAQDKRITLIRFEKNRISNLWRQAIREGGSGKYIMLLDSDDWLEPTFLERMVSLAERNQLDIVCTGSAFHLEERENMVSGTRSLPQRLIIDKPQYADYFPYYHAFFRTTWGKLMRREVFMSADLSIMDREEISNGSDTLSAFAWLRQAKRIGVDDSVLHHYLVRHKSVSRIYLPNRFKSNTVLYQDAIDFLSRYGPVSQQNRHFLHMVYANAVYDTLEVLWTSDLSSEEKLAEYCTIATHPTTREAYQDTDAGISRSRNALLQQLLAVADKVENFPENFSAALQMLLPQCGQVFSKEFLPLFQRETTLMDALLRDDWDTMVERIMTFIVEKKYIKQFPLGKMLNNLIPKTNPLCAIADVRFFQKHPEISMLALCENYSAALNQMTGILLERKKIPLEEQFLQLYLALAAQEREDPAFVFGKIRLADYHIRQGRFYDARVILNELTELGVQENEELLELRSRVKESE